ncbi:MAG: hydrolase 1, exosortase A system-associated [Gammaproteobacteria bacterium]|nr:hydrolase 1, exosortase A system-associated [Gammaproteobacteria bacterium]
MPAPFGGYLPSPSGKQFFLYFPPAPAVARGHHIVHVPAFADEMNKARRTVAVQARAFAAAGIGVLIPDLKGCGDSSGDFSAADWQGWQEDIHRAVEWVERECRPSRLGLWGLRLGGLLAVDYLRSRPAAGVDDLLLWQPVLRGHSALTQFLRLRVVMTAFSEGATETAASMRARLAAGETLEVAGYGLNPALAGAMDAAGLDPSTPPPVRRVMWLELAGSGRETGAGSTPPGRSAEVIAGWRAAAVAVDAEVVRDEPFWATQEIATAVNLVQATMSLCAADAPGHAGGDGGVTGLAPGSVPAPTPAPSASRSPREEKAGLRGADATGPETPATEEAPLFFPCEGDALCGILHRPARPLGRGVLVVVGGPQYRVGSHRQFVLLARTLAAAGVPVLRFDYRGMGDSEGGPRGFEHIEQDIRAAVDGFFHAVDGLEQVAIWGLCDAATAGAFYGPADARVTGMVLVNPWVRSAGGEARAYLRHYYLRRLASRDFWAGLFKGRVRLWRSMVALGRQVKTARGAGDDVTGGQPDGEEDALAVRMASSLERFDGRILLIMSGNDLTAAEFQDTVTRGRRWQALLTDARFQRHDLPPADHTFSRREWADQVSQWTLEWMQEA